MYDAPPRSRARTAFCLPEHWHRPGGDTPEWCKAQRPGLPGSSFIEGPVFDKTGTLWFCDIAYGRLFRYSPAQGLSLALQYAGEPNGLGVGPDGLIYIADYSEGLLRFDPRTQELAPLLNRVGGARLKGVNDLIFSRDGDLYFTDQGSTGMHDPTGCVYRLRRCGGLDCLLDNVPSPNGLVLSPDERTLFLAVTRDNAVWRVPLPAQGGVMKVGAYIRLSGGTGPDGLAMDARGNLVVCHLGIGSVWVFDPWGEPLRRIDSPAGRLTTNATFSKDQQSLYITESDSGSMLCIDADW